MPHSFSLWHSNIQHCGKTSSFDQDSTDFIQKIKYLSINPEEETLVSFDVSALFTSIPVPIALQVINSKISTCTTFIYVCKITTEKIIKLLEFTLTNCIFCINTKFYKQLQGAAISSPVSPVIANIYMEYFESLAIPSSPMLIKWWFRYVDDVYSATRKDQVNQLQEHLNSIDPHIKFTIELPGTDGLPFLDTLTQPTPNSIESTVHRKPTHTERYIDYDSNHLISAKLSVIHTLTHRAKQVCSTCEFLAKEMDHLHKVLQDNHYPTHFFQQSKPQQKTNKKPNPFTVKFIEGARVVIPYIKGLSDQYRHTLAKYRVRVFFKGTSTIKSLLMYPKDPIPDAQKTDIIYHWKCPAHNCTAEYICETNRCIKERVSDHRNQTPSAIRNHHISTKHLKAECKDFTIIDRENNTLHHQGKETLHICIKDPSLNRNIGKVRIPSLFNKLLKPPRQLELPHSSIPHPRGHLLHLVFQQKRQLTLHTFLISIYNRSVIPMFTPFKLQDN